MTGFPTASHCGTAGGEIPHAISSAHSTYWNTGGCTPPKFYRIAVSGG